MFSPILVPRLSPGTCGFRPARRGFRFRLAVALFLGALSVWLAAEPGPDRVSLTNQSDRAWTLLTSATNRARTSLAV